MHIHMLPIHMQIKLGFYNQKFTQRNFIALNINTGCDGCFDNFCRLNWSNEKSNKVPEKKILKNGDFA